MDEQEGLQPEKLRRKGYKRRAHTSALENVDNIAQLIKAGQELPFLLPISFAEKGKATYICSEGHKARLEIYNCLPEEEKPFYDWTLQQVEVDGAWWVEVGPATGKQRQVSASAKAVSEALRQAADKTRKPINVEAPRTTDDVLKDLGYY